MRTHIARVITAVVTLFISMIMLCMGMDSASACTRPTYTQRLHTMAAQVWAHGKPCAFEDGSGGPLPCKWDAGSMGNGRGNSFVVLNGGVTADGYQRVVYVYRNGTITRGGWGI